MAKTDLEIARTEAKTALLVAVISGTVALFGAIIGIWASIVAARLQDSRERVVGRIDAVPRLRTFIEEGKGTNQFLQLSIFNEGPVSAMSVVSRVQQAAFTNFVYSALLQGDGSHPWFFTNSLAGGTIIERRMMRMVPLKGENQLFRVQTTYYPEHNFTRQLTNIEYFVRSSQGFILNEANARRDYTNFDALVRQMRSLSVFQP